MTSERHPVSVEGTPHRPVRDRYSALRSIPSSVSPATAEPCDDGLLLHDTPEEYVLRYVRKRALFHVTEDPRKATLSARKQEPREKSSFEK